MKDPGEHLLVLSCPDRPGIVHAVSSFLVMTGCNILDSQQYRDPDTDRFFLRVHPGQLGGDRDDEDGAVVVGDG